MADRIIVKSDEHITPWCVMNNQGKTTIQGEVKSPYAFPHLSGGEQERIFQDIAQSLPDHILLQDSYYRIVIYDSENGKIHDAISNDQEIISKIKTRKKKEYEANRVSGGLGRFFV